MYIKDIDKAEKVSEINNDMVCHKHRDIFVDSYLVKDDDGHHVTVCIISEKKYTDCEDCPLGKI
jgi:hypothetical protein